MNGATVPREYLNALYIQVYSSLLPRFIPWLRAPGMDIAFKYVVSQIVAREAARAQAKMLESSLHELRSRTYWHIDITGKCATAISGPLEGLSVDANSATVRKQVHLGPKAYVDMTDVERFILLEDIPRPALCEPASRSYSKVTVEGEAFINLGGVRTSVPLRTEVKTGYASLVEQQPERSLGAMARRGPFDPATFRR